MLIKIYNENPQPREIEKVVALVREGGIVIYPTDTLYGIGCDALNVRAVEKICDLKGINPQKSNLSIICNDLSVMSEYARVSTPTFKLMKGPAGPVHIYITHHLFTSQNIQEQEDCRYSRTRQQYHPRNCGTAGKPCVEHIGKR